MEEKKKINIKLILICEVIGIILTVIIVIINKDKIFNKHNESKNIPPKATMVS